MSHIAASDRKLCCSTAVIIFPLVSVILLKVVIFFQGIEYRLPMVLVWGKMRIVFSSEILVSEQSSHLDSKRIIVFRFCLDLFPGITIYEFQIEIHSGFWEPLCIFRVRNREHCPKHNIQTRTDPPLTLLHQKIIGSLLYRCYLTNLLPTRCFQDRKHAWK